MAKEHLIGVFITLMSLFSHVYFLVLDVILFVALSFPTFPALVIPLPNVKHLLTLSTPVWILPVVSGTVLDRSRASQEVFLMFSAHMWHLQLFTEEAQTFSFLGTDCPQRDKSAASGFGQGLHWTRGLSHMIYMDMVTAQEVLPIGQPAAKCLSRLGHTCHMGSCFG